MNQLGQAIIMRNQAEKINNNFYRDLLDYSNEELMKTPNNMVMLIAQSYALMLEAIEQCEKVLIQESQHLHALNRKSVALSENI